MPKKGKTIEGKEESQRLKNGKLIKYGQHCNKNNNWSLRYICLIHEMEGRKGGGSEEGRKGGKKEVYRKRRRKGEKDDQNNRLKHDLTREHISTSLCEEGLLAKVNLQFNSILVIS